MRIVSLLLAVVMIVGMCVGVNAAPVSQMLESTHIVNVVGELEEADGNIMLL